jgi:hypothetical protein
MTIDQARDDQTSTCIQLIGFLVDFRQISLSTDPNDLRVIPDQGSISNSVKIALCPFVSTGGQE